MLPIKVSWGVLLGLEGFSPRRLFRYQFHRRYVVCDTLHSLKLIETHISSRMTPHYGHMIRIKIVNQSPVSILKHLSWLPQTPHSNDKKHFKYQFKKQKIVKNIKSYKYFYKLYFCN